MTSISTCNHTSFRQWSRNLCLVRPMWLNRLALATVLTMASVHVSGKDHAAHRLLVYTSQRNYSVMVAVSVADTPSGPTGQVTTVQIGASGQKTTTFPVKPAQFEKIWSSFAASGIDQFPIEEARHTIDLDDYYIFMAGGHKYAIPKKRASPVTAALAKQMEAYANNAPELRNLPRAAKSIEPQRVIIH
jgi:hypothetical protein